MTAPARRIAHLQRNLAALRQRLAGFEALEEAPRNATTAMLQTSLEELHVAEETLCQQNEVLFETRQIAEAMRARYEALFALVPEGYLVTTAQGSILEANLTAATLLGYSPKALARKPLTAFILLHDRKAFRTQMVRCLMQPQPHVWETTIQPRHRPPFPAALTVVASHSLPGMPTIPVFLWLIRDLTEQHRLEHERQRAAHLSLLGTLASSVSHDIRDPLSAITLFTEVLDDEIRQLQLPAAVHTRIREGLAEVQRARLRMQHMVEDYLALARGWDLQREPTALGVFLTAFAEDMALYCTTQGITVAVAGLAELGVVPLHQSTFRRALLNLVQNAIEAMPQGGTLTLRGHQTATQCILEVCDTGIGIPEEQIPQLFLPLHTAKAHGTGLGLYVVQEILAAHGAELVVQSEPGHGTTFTITLPYEPVQPTPTMSAVRVPEAHTRTPEQ